MRGRTMVITALDVQKIVGTRLEGTVVNLNPSKEDISKLCEQYGFDGGIVLVKKLNEDLRSIVDGGDDFRCRFALVVLGCFYYPRTKNGISTNLLHFVKNPFSLGSVNWGRLLLDHLVIGIRKYKVKKNSGHYIAGCVFFLMVSTM